VKCEKKISRGQDSLPSGLSFFCRCAISEANGGTSHGGMRWQILIGSRMAISHSSFLAGNRRILMRTIYFEKSIPKILMCKALQPIWPAVVYSRFSPTRFADVPEEPLPGARWVRVRNRLCGICASDLHLLFVDADPRVSPAALPGTERIYLGHEVMGEIIEVGKDVQHLKPGA
jgi:hypothetical protein